MTKHTPGPWWPIKDSAGSWGVRTLRDESDTLIGDRYGASICCCIGDHTEARTRGNEKANAHLISAAPDMLAALEEVWAAYSPQYVSAMADDAERTALDEAFDGVRSAIANAKGE